MNDIIIVINVWEIAKYDFLVEFWISRQFFCVYKHEQITGETDTLWWHVSGNCCERNECIKTEMHFNFVTN